MWRTRSILSKPIPGHKRDPQRCWNFGHGAKAGVQSKYAGEDNHASLEFHSGSWRIVLDVEMIIRGCMGLDSAVIVAPMGRLDEIRFCCDAPKFTPVWVLSVLQPLRNS